MIKPDSEYSLVNNYFKLINKGYELVIYSYEDKCYYLDGLLHRENAPAIVRGDGYQAWRIHDKLHRINGPARIWKDGEKEYLIDDIIYYEEHEYWEKIFSTKKYVKELVKFCPICETYFGSKEETAVHLDQELEFNTKINEYLSDKIIQKRIKLIVK